MNETQIKEAARIIESRNNGEKIQFKPLHTSMSWLDVPEGRELAFNRYDYQIAPKRSLSDLPVDTLIEVGGTRLYTDGKDSAFLDGATSATVTVHNPVMPIADFKVVGGLITEWHGSECPVPDWVKVRVWLRSGRIIEGVATEFLWHKTGTGGDIILYQIIGEVE